MIPEYDARLEDTENPGEDGQPPAPQSPRWLAPGTVSAREQGRAWWVWDG